MSVGGRIRVLVVDDSTTARAVLVHLFEADPDTDVVGEAANGDEAIQLVHRLRPSVVVMDIEMPVLDGLEATKRIMVDRPTPIVIVTSTVDRRDVEGSLNAVRFGALSVLPKPGGPNVKGFERDGQRLVSLVKAFADVKVVRRRWTASEEAPAAAGRPVRSLEPGRRSQPVEVVGVAASTGGPAALYRLLEGLPPELAAPILVVQHIARGFVPGFVSWLGSGTALPVKAAHGGEPLAGGVVYVAPDDAHLEVTSNHRVRLSSDAPVRGFRPSATCLFTSLALTYGSAAIGVVLTGMGQDGLEGARALRAAGSLVFAQDEQSAAVFGMPGAVVAAGLADGVGPVDQLARMVREVVPMREGRR